MRVRLAGIMALCIIPLCAQSQPNVRRFEASPFSGNNVTVDSARSLGIGHYKLRLIGDFEKRSLIFMNGGQPNDILGQRLTFDAAVAYGLLDWLDAGVVVPLAIGQTGQVVSDGSTIQSVALGQPRLGVRTNLLNDRANGFELSLVTESWLPLNGSNAYMGEDGPGVQAQLVSAIYPTGRNQLSLSLGYYLRPETELAGLTVDDELRLALAANHRFRGTPFKLTGETRFATDAKSPFQTKQTNAGDVNLGITFSASSGHDLVLGAGMGVLSGIGSPAWRAFAGYNFAGSLSRRTSAPTTGYRSAVEPPMPADSLPQSLAQTPTRYRGRFAHRDMDGDGIIGADDNCPLHPEDKDYFEDEDGCPDLDNDRDGIPDTKDVAPNWAEDWDGFEDSDGVADADNDGDGLEDTVDACPNASGAGNGCPGSPLAWLARLKHKAFNNESQPVRLGRLIVPTMPIEFDEATNRPTANSQRAIGNLAKFIKLNPELIQIEVGVHVRTKRSADFDLWLSRIQANALTKALVSEGVDTVRLFPAGYGRHARSDTFKVAALGNSHVELRDIPEGETPPVLGSLEAPDGLTLDEAFRGGEAVKPQVIRRAKPFRPLKSIKFVPRKAKLTKDGEANLDQLLDFISKQEPTTRFEVGVHTDGLGDKKAKLALSLKRAKVLVNALVKAGVSQDRLEPKGYGATKPLGNDKTVLGRVKNRRVELRRIETEQTKSSGSKGQ
ncbi:MAG: OmpA family protein [Myxococcota bacterium]|nr:OmpA family protein [Myxococcota bacterium]